MLLRIPTVAVTFTPQCWLSGFFGIGRWYHHDA